MRSNEKIPQLSKVLASVRDSLPTLTLQSYVPIKASNGTAFRITASHLKPFNGSSLVLSHYVEMCQEAFGENFSVLPGSLDVVASTDKNRIVSGILTANTISKTVTAKSLHKDKYKLVSANVFMDDEDKIWKMVGDGDTRRLVQAIQEDLSKILESRIARKASAVIAGNQAHYLGVTPERGDYAVYYSVVSNDYDYGYAVVADGEIYIAPRLAGGIEKVESSQIIDCVEASSLDTDKQDKQVIAMMFGGNKATSGNFSSDMGKEYLDYMRQIYADTPFFSKLEELIANRRSFADLTKPLSTSDI